MQSGDFQLIHYPDLNNNQYLIWSLLTSRTVSSSVPLLFVFYHTFETMHASPVVYNLFFISFIMLSSKNLFYSKASTFLGGK